MNPPLLILAQSARMLAQSARRGGFSPLVLDLFGDCDTRAASHEWLCLSPQGGRFDPDQLMEAALKMIRAYRPVGWIYGSGPDAWPEVIAAVARQCPLYGNGPETVHCCGCADAFFPLLDRLGIPYPEVRRAPPPGAGWLFKSGGEGGRGVWMEYRAGKAGYFQRRLRGSAFTLMFLAGGGEMHWYGFNRLYLADYNARQPFLFGGAINRVSLPRHLADAVIGYARRLCAAMDLRGLHGLDFMLDGATPRVLELNPRPGAALSLWDDAWPAGGVAAHVCACLGRAVAGGCRVPVRAFRILHARRLLRIPQDWRWPPWCADLPLPGSSVDAGEPVCSVIATGATVAAVEVCLQRRIAWIERLFNQSLVEVE